MQNIRKIRISTNCLCEALSKNSVMTVHLVQDQKAGTILFSNILNAMQTNVERSQYGLQ